MIIKLLLDGEGDLGSCLDCARGEGAMAGEACNGACFCVGVSSVIFGGLVAFFLVCFLVFRIWLC